MRKILDGTFENHYSYMFDKSELISIWKPNDRNWRDKIYQLKPKLEPRKKHIQYRQFNTPFEEQIRIEQALKDEILAIKESSLQKSMGWDEQIREKAVGKK